MAYKNNDPCLEKAFADEKIFVLLARDPTAPLSVIDWIKHSLHLQPPEKLHEALDTAIEMLRTQKEMYTRSHPFPDRSDMFDAPCSYCEGKGEIEVGTLYNSVKSPCDRCGGSGKIRSEQKVVEAVNKTFKMPEGYEYCDQCDGCGWYEGGPTIKTMCGTCKGTGIVLKKDNIFIDGGFDPNSYENKLKRGKKQRKGYDWNEDPNVEGSKAFGEANEAHRLQEESKKPPRKKFQGKGEELSNSPTVESDDPLYKNPTFGKRRSKAQDEEHE